MGTRTIFYNGGLQATHVPRREFVMATSDIIRPHSQLEGTKAARRWTTGRLGIGRQKGWASAVLGLKVSFSVSSTHEGVCLTPAPPLPSQKKNSNSELQPGTPQSWPFSSYLRMLLCGVHHLLNLSVPQLTHLENSRSHRTARWHHQRRRVV